MSSHVHEFTELLTGHQQRLFRYVVSMLGNADAAWDVLQETNRVLLEKRAEFEPGTSFTNWSLTVAQFQTLAWLRNQKRDRLIATAEIVELLAQDARERNELVESRRQALRTCLQTLSRDHRELVRRRYLRAERLADLSAYTGRSVNALKQMFFRLRGTLHHCIQQQLKADEG